jgi:putative tryptophan/tyrosine transport system substrate-binding protein
MKRREFITVLGSAAASSLWPLAARAQQPALPVVGFLHMGSPDQFAHLVEAWRRGLNDMGYVEGQNFAIEFRWAEGHYDRLPALAADLVRRQVAVIFVSGGPPGVLAAKAATTTIPIAFIASDPVKFGIVTSFSRPDGNLTGFGLFTATIGAKRLELLGEVAPSAGLIAYLVNPAYPTAEAELKDMQEAASASGKQLSVLEVSGESEFDAAFVTLVQQRAGALVVAADTLFTNWRDRLVALSTRHSIPTIYFQREFVVAGGLMSYGNSLTDAYRQAGVYTDRMLKGAKPADLPVQQPTKFELVINLKTAKALGLTVPNTLLVAADEVIE